MERPLVTVMDNSGCIKSGWRINYSLRGVKKIDRRSASADFKSTGNGIVIEMKATAEGRRFGHTSNPITGYDKSSMRIVNTSTSGDNYMVDVEGADPTDYFN